MNTFSLRRLLRNILFRFARETGQFEVVKKSCLVCLERHGDQLYFRSNWVYGTIFPLRWLGSKRNFKGFRSNWIGSQWHRLPQGSIEQLKAIGGQLAEHQGKEGIQIAIASFLPQRWLFSQRVFEIDSLRDRMLSIRLSDFGGYGHFMAEVLPAYLWLRLTGWGTNRIKGPQFYQQALEFADEAIGLGPGGFGNKPFDPEILDDRNYPSVAGARLVQSVLGEHSESPLGFGRRIFVERNPENSRARFLSRDQIPLELLLKFGIEIIDPAQLSFLEQVQLFREAELVVGVHGSGLFNAVFQRPNTRILEIAPFSDYRWGVISFSEACGLQHEVIFADVTDDGRVVPNWSEVEQHLGDLITN